MLCGNALTTKQWCVAGRDAPIGIGAHDLGAIRIEVAAVEQNEGSSLSGPTARKLKKPMII
jgi:hypothetical protein